MILSLGIHKSFMDPHNKSNKIHNSIMNLYNETYVDLHDWLMESHNWLMELHNSNYGPYSFMNFHKYYHDVP